MYNKVDSIINSNVTKRLYENSQTFATVDFYLFLGDSLKDKFESWYTKVSEVGHVMCTKGAKGHLFLILSNPMSLMPEMSSKFCSAEGCEWMPQGTNEVLCTGMLDRKFRCYRDDTLEDNHLIIGHFSSLDPPKVGDMSAKINFSNYVV